ncbi:DUF5708 family protein [Streptomyces sp. S186]|uniref:DUF5708 family protein n=1 Tax=Streptomyces sp. S186 TaxID=3434395 RepID=UPI003F676CD0
MNERLVCVGRHRIGDLGCFHDKGWEFMKGIAVGILLAIVGVILWLTTREVETPVVSLHKIGLVLAIVGGAEALFAVLGLGKKTTK